MRDPTLPHISGIAHLLENGENPKDCETLKIK